MTLETISIGLVTAGIIFILVEVFIPGGIVGTLGAILLAAGVIGGFTVSPLFGLILLVISLFAGITAFWLWLKFFPRTPIGRRVILQNDASDWHGFDQHQSELLGKTGVADSPLRPSGIATIGGKRIDVVTRGEMIPASTPVKVIEVAGNRVVVTQDKEATEKEQTN